MASFFDRLKARFGSGDKEPEKDIEISEPKYVGSYNKEGDLVKPTQIPTVEADQKIRIAEFNKFADDAVKEVEGLKNNPPSVPKRGVESSVPDRPSQPKPERVPPPPPGAPPIPDEPNTPPPKNPIPPGVATKLGNPIKPLPQTPGEFVDTMSYGGPLPSTPERQPLVPRRAPPEPPARAEGPLPRTPRTTTTTNYQAMPSTGSAGEISGVVAERQSVQEARTQYQPIGAAKKDGGYGGLSEIIAKNIDKDAASINVREGGDHYQNIAASRNDKRVSDKYVMEDPKSQYVKMEVVDKALAEYEKENKAPEKSRFSRFIDLFKKEKEVEISEPSNFRHVESGAKQVDNKQIDSNAGFYQSAEKARDAQVNQYVELKLVPKPGAPAGFKPNDYGNVTDVKANSYGDVPDGASRKSVQAEQYKHIPTRRPAEQAPPPPLPPEHGGKVTPPALPPEHGGTVTKDQPPKLPPVTGYGELPSEFVNPAKNYGSVPTKEMYDQSKENAAKPSVKELANKFESRMDKAVAEALQENAVKGAARKSNGYPPSDVSEARSSVVGTKVAQTERTH